MPNILVLCIIKSEVVSRFTKLYPRKGIKVSGRINTLSQQNLECFRYKILLVMFFEKYSVHIIIQNCRNLNWSSVGWYLSVFFGGKSGLFTLGGSVFNDLEVLSLEIFWIFFFWFSWHLFFVDIKIFVYYQWADYHLVNVELPWVSHPNFLRVPDHMGPTPRFLFLF